VLDFERLFDVETCPLTTSADSFTGGATDDTFFASTVYDANEIATATSTLTAADFLTGGLGTDTLNLSISGAQDAAVVIEPATITGIEVINVRNVSAQVVSLNASTVTGLTSFNADRSTGEVTVTNLASGASAGMIGNGAVVTGAFNAGYVAAATAATINLSNGVNGGAVVLTGTGVLATTINSTGAANTIGAVTNAASATSLKINATSNLTTAAIGTNTAVKALELNATGGSITTGAITAAAATTVNITGTSAVNTDINLVVAPTITVSGSGAVDLGLAGTKALSNLVETVTSTQTGGSLTLAAGTLVSAKITGGAGADVFTTGAVLTTGFMDGGAGSDTLDLGTNVAHVNTTALAAKYTNFETIRIGAAALDMSLVSGITGVQVGGAATLTKMTAAQAASVSARANIGNASFALADASGTSDVLTITNGLGTTTAAATTIGTLVAEGFETINLVTNAGPTATSGTNRTTSVVAITDASLTAVNLTGTAFTFGDIASTKAVAWNAAGLTGNGSTIPVGLTLTTTGAAFAGSVVTGSAVRDSVIMTSSTGVTFNLGAGNDIFSTTSTLLLPAGIAADNTINAGEGTSDKLVFTGASTLTDTSFSKSTGFEALELAGAGDESITGLGAGFLGAFANGVTVTDTNSGALAKAYTWASGLYDKNVTLTHTTLGTGGATDSNQSITTGGGADVITLDGSAAFVGKTAAGGGKIVVSTGAGADTITVSTSTLLTTASVQAVTITGGTGADIINATTHVNGAATTGLIGNFSFVIAAGDSTTTAFDQITGFRAGATSAGEVSDGLDFSNATLNAYTATAATGFSAGQLTVAVSAVGAVTFAGTSAASLTVAQKIAAVQSVVVTVNGDSAFFIDGGSTYVFNNETAGDVVVQLSGLTGITALITTNAATANAIFIA
jgi:hypothetical protein